MTTNARLRKSDVAPAPQWGSFVECSTKWSPDDRNTDVGRRVAQAFGAAAMVAQFAREIQVNPGDYFRYQRPSIDVLRGERRRPAAHRWSRTLRRSPHDRPPWPPSRPRRVGGCGEVSARVRLDAAPACGVRDDAEPPPFASPGFEGSTTLGGAESPFPPHGGTRCASANTAVRRLSRPKPGTLTVRRPVPGVDRPGRSVNYDGSRSARGCGSRGLDAGIA